MNYLGVPVARHHINLQSAPNLQIIRTDNPLTHCRVYTAVCWKCGCQVYQVLTDAAAAQDMVHGIEAFIREHARCQRFGLDHLAEGSY